MRTVDKIRYILNVLFLIGAALTLVLFLLNGDGYGFRYTGMAALTFKIMEFILRFVN